MKKLSETANMLTKLAKTIKKDVAIEALNHYKDKFVAGGGKWKGAAWQAPKRQTEGPKKYKTVDKNGKDLTGRKGYRNGYQKGFSPRDKSRAVLVKNSVLSRSIKYRIEASSVVFYSNTAYAARHNQGLDGMVKRQFLGMEKPLRAKILRLIKGKMGGL